MCAKGVKYVRACLCACVACTLIGLVPRRICVGANLIKLIGVFGEMIL